MTAPHRSGAHTAQPKTSGKSPSLKTTNTRKTAHNTNKQVRSDHTTQLFGRVNILDVTPCRENDYFPARVELGEPLTVSAQVFIEGRAKVGATAVLRNPQGRVVQRRPMQCMNAGLDRWSAQLQAGKHSAVNPWESGFTSIRRQLGLWSITIEGWEDPYALWLHDATIKVQVNDDIANVLDEGAAILRQWANSVDAALGARAKKHLLKACETLSDNTLDITQRFQAADTPEIHRLHLSNPLRTGISSSRPKALQVQRPKSSFASWYQFFPRSEGAYLDPKTHNIVQGTLQTAISGLERAQKEGFDIVYLPPIFPIGQTNRKGRNNALIAGPNDPGSPFGIGSSQGGHDTVDPQLGNMDDFRQFCDSAHRLGLEIALDFALQCSPDHPWVNEHPNWFRHKADGSIAFAENPPKKYQDIYPIDFDEDMPGIEREVIRILELWIEAGVSIFRIDNPHTKPVRFWQDVIAAINKRHPEILFLAEAFTRPGMMLALSYVGFTQSHCYFPWRNTKEELAEYLTLSNSDVAYYQHNSFWPTTPDILTDYLRDNGIAGHAVRAVLAAMGSASWGIYNGFELIENRQRPGFEEQIDNEKYEIKLRDWGNADRLGIAGLLRTLNDIRRRHPSCYGYHNLSILGTDDPSILAFARHIPADFTESKEADTVIVVVNLDGHNAHASGVHWDPADFGFTNGESLYMHDELSGRDFNWNGNDYVSLAPWADVAHILSVSTSQQ
ncbi:MAG: alpha-1,4-glucan--maltose-1-phosphate maltosyltransferase [Bifidobacterium sp.]|jgi:starch synthase (maltosyl-transferring)|nr:alpha-1,4-glucan--maltose-1-phosphate maltosyltransferase [Bifidobacterium sp.]MCH4174765.1 alpha-1,4-glucan--maltose-1-phosphate maltosyltransferase [Bifidobacterium sp.]